MTFFQGQTVLLTGGTGCLGGCLLYKLVTELRTAGIYLLVRESPERARGQWRRTMPFQIDNILEKGNIQFVVGDMTMPNLGIESALLAEIAQRVTIVIHSAGNISLLDPLNFAVQANCLSALELARLASSFMHIVRFVHERIYDIGDPEAQLREILETGDLASVDVPRFAFTYALAKNLAERLLLTRYPKLPTLIVRPTLIGPALTRPHPFYGPQGSIPVSSFMHQYFTHPDSGVYRLEPEHPMDRLIIDEIPVDLVANLILLHVIHGTAGIVHASAQIFGPRTMAKYEADMRATGMPMNFSFVRDGGVAEGAYAQFWKLYARHWQFECSSLRPNPPITYTHIQHTFGKSRNPVESANKPTFLGPSYRGGVGQVLGAAQLTAGYFTF
ncbi:male sterility protein-domain-containing protein [Mycena rebaudengoi]|nr:male sterility protein-domain-containing protein [Mycena rebaudengoi]